MNKKGFSLVELLVVMAIIGILAPLFGKLWVGLYSNMNKANQVNMALAAEVAAANAVLAQMKAGTCGCSAPVAPSPPPSPSPSPVQYTPGHYPGDPDGCH